jgi:hypothetical protein
MLVKTALLLASCSLAVAAAAPLAKPDDPSAKQFIDNPRFGGRGTIPIEGRDETDSVRITEDKGGSYAEGARVKRDDTDSVRITGAGQGGYYVEGSGGYYAETRAPHDKREEDGPDYGSGHEWGKVKRGDESPEEGNEWGKARRGDEGPKDGSEWSR